MRNVLSIVFFAFLLSGCALTASHSDVKAGSFQKPHLTYDRTSSMDAAPGIPKYDIYGRPYKYAPQHEPQAPVLGPIKHNAYGPGVHMDATGRPVRTAPWP